MKRVCVSHCPEASISDKQLLAAAAEMQRGLKAKTVRGNFLKIPEYYYEDACLFVFKQKQNKSTNWANMFT